MGTDKSYEFSCVFEGLHAGKKYDLEVVTFVFLQGLSLIYVTT